MCRLLRAPTLALVAAVLVNCGGRSPLSSEDPTCTAITGPTSATLRAGDVFRYRFSLSPGLGVDALMTFMAEVADVDPQSGVAVALYDGTRRLGVTAETRETVVVFKGPDSRFGTPASPYGLSGPATVVDFTSIANGAIDGRVEYSVVRGTVVAEHFEKAAIMLIRPADPEDFQSARISGREVCR